MTDRIAFGLGLMILLAIGADVLTFGDQHLLYLGMKFVDFVDYVDFWR